MGCGASSKKHNYNIQVDSRGTSKADSRGNSKISVHPERISNRISPGASHKAQLPEYWSRQDNAEEHFHEHLECSTESPGEVKEVQDLIDMTLDAKAPSLVIERLIRVEDSMQWALYDQAIDHIEGVRENRQEEPWMIKSPSGTLQQQPLTTRYMPDQLKSRLRAYCNETYLWHGTTRQNAEKILRDGFDMTRCGEAHAKILGRGAYFAERVSLADRYAPADEDDGLHAILLVRVALGKVYFTRRYTGWRGHKLVRLISTSKLVRSGECDSVLGDRNRQFNASDIREYCIPNKSQLYPEYMVLYRREGDDLQPHSSKSSIADSVNKLPTNASSAAYPESLRDASNASKRTDSKNSDPPQNLLSVGSTVPGLNPTASVNQLPTATSSVPESNDSTADLR